MSKIADESRDAKKKLSRLLKGFAVKVSGINILPSEGFCIQVNLKEKAPDNLILPTEVDNVPVRYEVVLEGKQREDFSVKHDGFRFLPQIHFGSGFYEVKELATGVNGLALYRDNKWDVSPNLREHQDVIVKHSQELLTRDLPRVKAKEEELKRKSKIVRPLTVVGDEEENTKSKSSSGKSSNKSKQVYREAKAKKKLKKK